MSDDARVGTEFGRYRIERVLGQGGFGTVYYASDLNPHLPRHVALKVLNPELAADPSFRDRFLRESMLAIELDHHPNIVPVFDAGEADGTLFIAMRFIDGVDLAATLNQRGALGGDQVVPLIRQIGDALDTAHAAGIVHRDVKPGNILLARDLRRAYLADFGLTKRLSATSGITQAGQFLGTFYYAAPEQIEGKEVDGRTDQYALGCVLHESLTGSPPFTGDMNVIVASHLAQPPPVTSVSRPGLPGAIDSVVARAMAKSPADRFSSCAELAEAAGQALGQGSASVSSGAPLLVPPPPASTIDPAAAAAASGAAAPSWGETLPPPPPTGGPYTPPPVPVSVPGAPYTPPPPSSPGAPASWPPASPPPLPPQGPGGPVGPTPAKKRSPLPFVLAGAAALVVVILILVFALGGGDEGGGGGGGGGDGTAAFPDASERELLDQIPASLRSSCERARRAASTGGQPGVGGRGTEAAVRCTPSVAGADVVFFTLFGDRGATETAFDDAAAAGSIEEAATGEDCIEFTGVQHDYGTDDNVDGRVACYRDGGESYLLWSMPEFRLVGSAQRDDRNDLDLYEWWAEAVDRTPPEGAGTGDALTAAEQDLLTHVPAEHADTCVGIAPNTDFGEVAALECTPVDGSDTAFYTQFDSAESMSETYSLILEDRAIALASGPGCATEPPSENGYDQGSVEAGRAACFFGSEDEARLVWTHDPTLILSEGIRNDGDYPGLLDWWGSEGGPLT